ncbi:MAG: ABC transporter permease [Opitutaceae bacterium]
MKRLIYEFTESFRIAFAQIRANKLRSVLTALGVIIGIVAVTLMGTAISGIDKGFQNSLAMLGDDVLYVQKWPWGGVQDWWNYQNRPRITADLAEKLNQIIDATPNSTLEVAVPVAMRGSPIKNGEYQVTGTVLGTNGDYSRITAVDLTEGRFFNETEANSGRPVCIIGADIAEALFQGRTPLDQLVQVGGHPCKVIGVLAKQGSFLGLISFDNQVFIPLESYKKYFSLRRDVQIRVKVKDKNRLEESRDELVGDARRVRSQLPGERDNFSINEQQAFKAVLEPVKRGIAIAGLFITGLSLFVGAIGIMNITFVSVKERTKEIGTRKALGARRRTILLQFLIEAVSICMIGGVVGLLLTYAACIGLQAAMPSFPIDFSVSLVIISMLVSVVTGIVSGFAPAWGAARLDPVVALRYE